jgi:hypothetical protein
MLFSILCIPTPKSKLASPTAAKYLQAGVGLQQAQTLARGACYTHGSK